MQYGPDLQRIVDAWPTLSESIRLAVMALVGTAAPSPAAKAARRRRAEAEGM
jgi:hypothetical protein